MPHHQFYILNGMGSRNIRCTILYLKNVGIDSCNGNRMFFEMNLTARYGYIHMNIGLGSEQRLNLRLNVC